MSNISQMQHILQEKESDVEDVPTINDLIYSLPIRKQEKSLNEYIQPLGSQLLIKVDELSINFKSSSDSESEEFILREKSLQDISTVGVGFRKPYENDNETKSINFTVANLNLIVKKEENEQKEEDKSEKGETKKKKKYKKENIPIPIKLEQDTDKSPIIYSMAYHFDTSSAENEEKISVEKRLKSAKRVIDSLGLKYSDLNKTDDDFNRYFRHSEQALFEYLKTEDCISYLIGLMLENKVVKLQSVILDIYSTKNMCKNCQYSTYGVLSDMIEQQNQEFCGKLERSIRGYNRGRSRDNMIQIDNEDKKRLTFYRAVRLVFSEYYLSVDDKKYLIEDPFKKQDPFISDKQMYIQNINKRIIAKKYPDELSEECGSLIKEYTIFCSRGSYTNVLVEQLKMDRKRSENENNTKNNGGENGKQ